MDPITRLPIIDTNPRFTPRAVIPLPLTSNNLNKSAKDKGKMREKPQSVSILQFLGTCLRQLYPKGTVILRLVYIL